MNTEFNMARVADQSERYDDIMQFLTDVIYSMGEDLNFEERSLLSVGFKNLNSSQKSIWKTVHCNKSYAFSILEYNKKHYLSAYSTAKWRNWSIHLRRHRFHHHRRYHRFEPVRGTIIFIFIYFK